MTDSQKVTIDESTINQLKVGFSGDLIFPDHSSYDEYRSIWNGMIDKRPAIIARCLNSSDVVQCVNFARENDLLVAIKGGGHNVAGNAVCDGGIMIDLSLMKSVSVDPKAKTAKVEPGCLLGELDKETQKFGLVCPGGIVSTTGVAGYTLGGGFGWLSRKYGMTIDNLLSADIVTADGKLLRCAKDENADLFWGIRGGGGNFGVATSFEFKLHDLGPEVFCGVIVFPFESAKKYIQFHREFLAKAPRELCAWMVIRHAPPLPFLPEDKHGKLAVIVPFLYAGDPVEGEKIVKPLREWGTTYGEHVGVMPFTAWQSLFDALNEPGARNYWKSHNLNELSDGFIDAILEYIEKFPVPTCEVFIAHLDGAVKDTPNDATAYAFRDAPFLMNVHTRWTDSSIDKKCIAWARGIFEATKPYSAGSVYVNFMSDEGEDRVRDAYSHETWNRLVELKNKYDPKNLFRLNQNIKPTAS